MTESEALAALTCPSCGAKNCIAIWRVAGQRYACEACVDRTIVSPAIRPASVDLGRPGDPEEWR